MAFENPLQNFLLWGAILLGGSALSHGAKWGVHAWRHRKDPGPPSAYWEHQNGNAKGNPPPRPPAPDQ